MKKFKLVLKNVKFHQGREGHGVNADVWINGIKCLHVYDDGNGGCLDIDILSLNNINSERIKLLVAELSAYVNSIPEKPMEFNGENLKDDNGKVRMSKTSLEDFINERLYEYEKQQEAKKMGKLMQTTFFFGVPNATSYSYIKYKRKLSEIPKDYLQKSLDKIVKDNCIGEVKIFNTNLKELGLII